MELSAVWLGMVPVLRVASSVPTKDRVMEAFWPSWGKLSGFSSDFVQAISKRVLAAKMMVVIKKFFIVSCFKAFCGDGKSRTIKQDGRK